MYLEPGNITGWSSEGVKEKNTRGAWSGLGCGWCVWGVGWGGGGVVLFVCSLASVGGKHEIELVTPVWCRSFRSTLVQKIITPTPTQ